MLTKIPAWELNTPWRSERKKNEKHKQHNISKRTERGGMKETHTHTYIIIYRILISAFNKKRIIMSNIQCCIAHQLEQPHTQHQHIAKKKCASKKKTTSVFMREKEGRKMKREIEKKIIGHTCKNVPNNNTSINNTKY